MSLYEKYFDKKFEEITKSDEKNIQSLLSEDMILICGDFYGIQKFIFESLASKNAAKVLRAKSAFIQIFTEYLAKYVCYRLDIDSNNILSISAGKFEIISSNKDIEVLADIQKKVDQYFIKSFYGLSGVSICHISCQKSDFIEETKYRILRDNISYEIEKKKFKKFDLQNLDEYVLSYDENIDNQNLCPICNIRKGKNNCAICNSFIKLGEKLSNDTVDELINSSDLGISIDDFNIDIILNRKIKSYMLRDGNFPADFETLSQNSCKDLDTGIKSIAVLKADVDSMGLYLRDSDITKNFENFDIFSKTLDNFFSIYVPNLMKEKYKNTYTVFAGGDDLFLLGAWDEIISLARQIHKDFKIFIKEKLTISFGIVLVKPSYPVNRFADITESLLESAKGIDVNKDAITIFGQTVKWEEYLNVFDDINNSLSQIVKQDLNTAFLYRTLELCDMSINLKENFTPENAMWKSKLNYSFTRNMDKRYIEILQVLDKNIENYPKSTKSALSEFIYKRRES